MLHDFNQFDAGRRSSEGKSQKFWTRVAALGECVIVSASVSQSLTTWRGAMYCQPSSGTTKAAPRGRRRSATYQLAKHVL